MNEWIPVRERLPDYNQLVLVTGSLGGIFTAYYSYQFCEPDGYWVDGDGYWVDGGGHEMKNPPVAWMPLPEPYREDGRDDERVGALIDVIEDFLAERGVRLPESVEDDAVCGGAVVICGGDYDALASRIKEFFSDGHEL